MTKKSKLITFSSIAGLLLIILFCFLFSQFHFNDKKNVYVKSDEPFRTALSISPFTNQAFRDGFTYQYKDRTITSTKELQELYIEKGSTEMFIRISTRRYLPEIKKEEAYTPLEETLSICKLAADLNVPINPEVMCAFDYMDMDRQEAPCFEEYPEIYALQNGKAYEELNLEEMCVVLKAYGHYLAKGILETGCTVNNWNLGNEANYGFAGINLGLKTAVNPKLESKGGFIRYMLPVFNCRWLENNLWKYNAKQFAAVRQGILDAYDELGLDKSNVKFSTHIATVVMTPKACARYFNCLKANGYDLDTAGISYYPSAPSMYLNSMIMFKKTVTEINKKCGLNVFIAEFAYPSGEMSGPYAGWNKEVKGYPHSEEGQKAIYNDVVEWGNTHGVSGIRYWAADYKYWGTMPMFNFDEKKASPKSILVE